MTLAHQGKYLGNIAGVAIAIHTGGPGAIFWMWLTAVIGMSTKFFTCTLSVLFRGKDDQGEVQGGVMYYIEEGLGKQQRDGTAGILQLQRFAGGLLRRPHQRHAVDIQRVS